MNQGLARKPGQMKVLSFALQKFAQQKRLPREPLRAGVVAEKVEELIPKNRGTARFEHYNWHPAIDFMPKRIKYSQQQLLRSFQHAEVIQRPSAAEGRPRNRYAKSGSFKHLYCGLGCMRVEIVIEGVGPKDNLVLLLCRLVWRRVFDPPGRGGAPFPHGAPSPHGLPFPHSIAEPFPKCLRSKFRNSPLPRHPGHQLGEIASNRKLGCQVHQPRCH